MTCSPLQFQQQLQLRRLPRNHLIQRFHHQRDRILNHHPLLPSSSSPFTFPSVITRSVKIYTFESSRLQEFAISDSSTPTFPQASAEAYRWQEPEPDLPSMLWWVLELDLISVISALSRLYRGVFEAATPVSSRRIKSRWKRETRETVYVSNGIIVNSREG